MSIFEYNEETVMKYLQEDYFEEGMQEGLQKGMQEGIQEGLQKGIQKGETRKLIEQVCRKLKKKKSIQTIADELEEPYETIKQICKAADECGFEYDTAYCSEKIYEKLIQN